MDQLKFEMLIDWVNYVECEEEERKRSELWSTIKDWFNSKICWIFYTHRTARGA